MTAAIVRTVALILLSSNYSARKCAACVVIVSLSTVFHHLPPNNPIFISVTLKFREISESGKRTNTLTCVKGHLTM